MENQLLIEANKHISEPDIIVNLLDFSVPWLSPKAKKMSGYNQNDLDEKIIRITDIFGFAEEEARNTVWKNLEEKGTREFVTKLNNKQHKTQIKFNSFVFEGTNYRTGKIIMAEELKS